MFCSTSTMVMPDFLSSTMCSKMRATMRGASPSEGSSRIRRRGFDIMGPGDRQHLLLAAGQRAGDLVEPLAQHREHREIAVALAVEIALPPPHEAAEAEVLGDGEVGEDAPAFRHHRHGGAHPLLRRQGGDVAAVEHHLAGGGARGR
jgi:hypothetical protein